MKLSPLFLSLSQPVVAVFISYLMSCSLGHGNTPLARSGCTGWLSAAPRSSHPPPTTGPTHCAPSRVLPFPRATAPAHSRKKIPKGRQSPGWEALAAWVTGGESPIRSGHLWNVSCQGQPGAGTVPTRPCPKTPRDTHAQPQHSLRAYPGSYQAD